MCGIVGVIDPSRDPVERQALVRRMAARLEHRGPDGEGFVSSGPCSLGFRRLAIVDPEAPSVPFHDETRTVFSVANAEIYNAPGLRADLDGRGHRLRTGVDTEVLPHLWEEHGPDLVPRLEGMFALAVWDSRTRTLLLARDRAGEKPLFYWRGGDGSLAFASELRALLEHPDVDRSLDPAALREYLIHDYFPAPASPFASVRKLPAAHLLTLGPEGLRTSRYWDLATSFGSSATRSRRTADLARELDTRISEAVARRRRSDVPVGVFLSGGIDSTTVLGHLSEQVGPGVPAFAIGHRDPSFDESALARETSRFYGADFHPLVLDRSDLADGLDRVARGFDEPLGDASTIPTHLLALHAREHVKVVLSGEGADEIFAGYPTYLGHRVVGAIRSLPGPLRGALLGAARRAPVTMSNVGPAYLLRRFASVADLDLVERHHGWFGSHTPERAGGVLSGRVCEALDGADPWAAARRVLADRDLPDDLSRVLYTDFTMYLQDDLLTKVDRATMLASLEARAPFLDRDLAEFAAGLPSRHKLRGLQTKSILRRAGADRLPPAVLRRRKRGFNIPFSRWLLDGLGEELRQRFSTERVESRGLFSAPAVHGLLDEHLERRADHRKPIFNLLALDLWCDRTFGEGCPVPLAGVGGEVPAR